MSLVALAFWQAGANVGANVGEWWGVWWDSFRLRCWQALSFASTGKAAIQRLCWHPCRLHLSSHKNRMYKASHWVCLAYQIWPRQARSAPPETPEGTVWSSPHALMDAFLTCRVLISTHGRRLRTHYCRLPHPGQSTLRFQAAQQLTLPQKMLRALLGCQKLEPVADQTCECRRKLHRLQLAAIKPA